MSAPPAGSRRLLALVCPAVERDAVVADMDELYRLRLERDGPAAADAWYRRQVRAFLRAGIAGRWKGRTGAARGEVMTKPGAVGVADRVRQDVRLAWRQMARHPATTVVAVAVLALGVGASTAVFSIVDGVVLRPLPFPTPDRLVRVRGVMVESGARVGLAPPAHLLFAGSEIGSLEGMAVLTPDGLDLEGAGDPEHLPVAYASHELFGVLGVGARLGRTFTADEDRVGGPRVVVLSHRLWLRRFGSEVGVVGRTIRLGGEPRTVVGVMPRGFDFPDGVEAWLPVRDHLSGMEQVWGALFLDGVGRLREGVPPDAASRELTSLLEAIPEASRYAAEATLLHEELTADVRRPLLILFGAVILVLLVACANVAGLLLARAMERRRELAVRTALGASRRRLTAALLTESLLLAGIAGAVGALLAYLALDVFLALAPGALADASEVGVDRRALGFSLAATVLTGLAVGTLPALWVPPDVVRALKDADGHRAGAGRGWRGRSALVVSQVAVTVVLLTGASLLAGSFLRLMRQDAGFDPGGVVAAELSLPAHRYAREQDLLTFYSEVLDRVALVPGVDAVALTRNLPMAGRNLSAPVGRPGAEPVGRTVHVSATPGYFELMRTRIVRGRSFTRADVEGGGRPAVLSETLARSLFGDEDPLGERVVTMFGPDTMRVVGVAEDVRFNSLGDEPGSVLYRPLSHWTSRGIHIVARSGLPPSVVFPALRRALADVRPGQPVKELVTMQTLRARTAARPRFYALLLSSFAAVALLLSALGLYGLLLSEVTRQRRDIGIRLALGADAGRVARHVVGRGAVLTAAGLGIGLVAALLAGRVLESLLFGVRAGDAATLAGVVMVLGAGCLLATLPAVIRARRVHPARELASGS